MIRDAVVHLLNEQPLLADLYEAPAAGDLGLVCTNLRSLDGKRPVFIDRSDSLFIFPYSTIRFVEVPARSLVGRGRRGTTAEEPDEGLPDDLAGGAAEPAPAEVAEVDLELDEDFLRRIREA